MSLVTRIVVAVMVVASTVAVAEEGWMPLFNGENLDNWETKGGVATFEIDGDEIVGRSVPNTPNTFLCTKEHYGDFVLEFEFLAHPDLNSGVQIRSNSIEDFKDGRVHGYQVELEEESRDRDWSGGIYDEGRRGWIYPPKGAADLEAEFTQVGKAVWKAGEWNHIRVEAKGDHIQTWLNGTKRSNLKDDMDASGFIGLQVHGVGNREAPMEVRWRNIRIKPLADAEKE